MLETMKTILDDRVRTADSDPFFCPTCNAERHSTDVLLGEDEHSLMCKDCCASLCTIVEGPDHTYSLSEVTLPAIEPLYSPNRTMP